MIQRPLFLIVLQQFFSGVALVALYTAANALFLPDFGQDGIAYSFIAIGVLGALTTFGFRALQHRWMFRQLALLVYIGTMGFILISWYLLRTPGRQPVIFLLLVAYTIIYSLMNIIGGLQAARVFEGWQFRSVYPLIMAGQVTGVIVMGGLLTPVLNHIGRTENLLWLTTGGFMLSLLLMLLHMRVFEERYVSVTDTQPGQNNSDNLTLLREPFIQKIFMYIFVSYIGSRLVTFLGLAVIEQRFSDSERIAAFFGNMAAVITVLTLVFLLTASGYLMRRFGLRAGLGANPFAVLAAVIVALAVGRNENAFFWAVILAYALDFIFTVGTTDTSIRSVYRALPDAQRFGVETMVMGIIYPLSYGVAGGMVLLLRAMSFVSLVHVVTFTCVVSVVWGMLSMWLYGSYRRQIEADSELYDKLATGVARQIDNM